MKINMDIKTEIEKFCEILFNYYSGAKSDNFDIEARVLKNCGFDVEKCGVFDNVICPKLKREGILKDFSRKIKDMTDVIRSRSPIFADEDEMMRFYADRELDDTYFTFIVDGEKLKKEVGQEKKEEIIGKTKVSFDYDTATLTSKNKRYKPSDEKRKKIIQELWLKRRIEDSKKRVIDKGQPFPQNTLMQLIGMTLSDFKKTKKELNKILKRFQSRIDSTNEGILLVQTI